MALKSMYRTVKACVRYKTEYSELFSSEIGLKQGDPSSPLLFMMFVNDIKRSINDDINDLFTINELKIFLTLYADDQAVFGKSPASLQSLLTDIENYCNLWGLKINTEKTKIVIFEKGRRTNHDFYIYNTRLEVVEYFTYLGLSLFKNGSFKRTQKCIAKHAAYALNKLFAIFRNIYLPISQKCKLFDTLVGSILNFGSELWGAHEATDIEMVHKKFMKRILNVKPSTNISALYGELGRFPLAVIRNISMIRYWTKVINLDETSLVKKVYFMLKCDSDSDRNYGGRNWASQIKTILQNHGLLNVWLDQAHIQIPFAMIKQRILDNYFQSWHDSISSSPKLQTYTTFKHTLELEKYLDLKIENKYRIALTKLRTSSHNLAIETGRYDGIARENRTCTFCNMNAIENEFHLVLVCPSYRDLRQRYMKPYFWSWPTLTKFQQLMSSRSTKLLINLSKYIFFANQRRGS